MHMDGRGGSWDQETAMVLPDDYGILSRVLPSPLHLQPPSYPC